MRKILLADDSLTIQKVVELTFMDEDFEVQSVRSAAEALASLEAERPDVVIADIHVPGAGGYALCREARELHGGLPVLLLVGTFETIDEAEMAACGAAAHLKKPFDSQELLRTVEELTATGAAARAPEPAAESAPRPVGFEGTAHVEAGPVTAYPEPERARPAGFEGTAHEVETAVPEPESASAPSASEVASVAAEGAGNGGGPLSDEDVERIARRVAELLGERVLREVAWDVVPDLAEVVVKERLRELESQVE